MSNAYIQEKPANDDVKKILLHAAGRNPDHDGGFHSADVRFRNCGRCMADEDISTRSLGAYTVAMYLEKKDFGNRHLTTMSFNRSAFLIKGKDQKIEYRKDN